MASELVNMELCTDIYAQWSYSDHCSVLGVIHCAYIYIYNVRTLDESGAW